MICELCFHHCDWSEGQTGFCRARACRGGAIAPLDYGKVTSLALDPIEKKPLRRFHPGSRILSVGSFGCNLCCPFCQNHEISMSGDGELEMAECPRRRCGQAAHISGADVSAGRCGEGVPALCLYGELLMQKCLGLASYLQVVKQRKLKNFQGTKAAFGAV